MKSPFTGMRSAILELKNMNSNGFKVFSLCAIACIPLIYAGLFLLAFLDPYGSLNQVPAAVVNLDKGALIQDEQRNIGQELCDELVENNQNAEPGDASGYDWQFLGSEEEARAGLEDATYYMELVIPENFSESIASADSKNPQKAELQVHFNPSTNLIAQTVGSSMVTKIRAELNEKVQKSYFDNIFISLSDAADDLQEAVDGSAELSDGLESAQDGSNTITLNLGKLADGAGELADGLSDLSSGVTDLKGGADKLSSGTSDLADGTGQLKSGAKDLASGAKQLDSGASTLSAGASKLQKEGTASLAAGASQLDQATSAMPDEDQVSAATAGAQAIGAGFGGLGTAIDQLSAGVGSSDDTSSSTLYGGVNQLSGGVDQLKSGVGAASTGLGQVSSGLGQVSSGLATMKGSLESASQGAAGYEQAIQAMAGVLTAEQKAALSAGGLDVSALSQQAASGSLSKGLTSAAASIGSASSQSTLLGGVAAAKGGVDQVKQGLGTSSDQYDPSGSNTVYAGLNALGAGATGLKSGLASMKAGLGTSSDNTGASANDDAVSLYGGVNKLSAGYDSLSSQLMPLVQSAPQLRSAITALSAGATTVDQNMKTLSEGAGQLAAGTGALKNSVGTSKDTAEDKTVYGAVNSLDAGAGQLADGASALASGAGKLEKGAKSAQSGASTLEDGAQQLKDGSATLTEGLTSAVDGTAELHDGLAEGQQTMKDNTQNSDAKSQMMSAPVSANGSDQTGEKITQVANYGTGFAPYFIGLGMWVGCLMITFLFRALNNRILMSNSNSLSAVLSSFVPMAIIAVIQVTVLLLFIQFVLGFNVNYVPQFYAFGILTALAFMAIVQFFRASLGTAGMVVIVILLMLQLCTAAGTFPIEAELPVFNILNPLLPMTYVVKGFRMAMCGLDVSYMIQPALVLAGFTVAFLALTTAVAHHRRRANVNMMYPKIEMVH